MDILSLPKIELHCHLDGSLPPEFIRRYLLNRFGESVEDREMMVDPDCHDLAECLKKFDLPLRCLQDRAGLEEAGYQILRQAAAENVRYIETRFAPAQSTAEGLTVREAIRCWTGWSAGTSSGSSGASSSARCGGGRKKKTGRCWKPAGNF